MQLPTPLSRRNKKAHKNTYGHDLILAGSPSMLGASALCGLSAMRSGAGLVTIGVPQSCNLTLQKKISPVIMTKPLKETKERTLSFSAYQQIKDILPQYDAIAIGPGLSQNTSTKRLILKVIENAQKPLVIDADALNALSGNYKVLKVTKTPKILTPHPGEMARLTHLKKKTIEENRTKAAQDFAKKTGCIVLLKGYRTVVASSGGKIYINKTGNPGMATAGSGDVLTGMIVAFLGQGIEPFEAAKGAAYLHGKAADLAVKKIARASLIATDIIDHIPKALQRHMTQDT